MDGCSIPSSEVDSVVYLPVALVCSVLITISVIASKWGNKSQPKSERGVVWDTFPGQLGILGLGALLVLWLAGQVVSSVAGLGSCSFASGPAVTASINLALVMGYLAVLHLVAAKAPRPWPVLAFIFSWVDFELGMTVWFALVSAEVTLLLTAFTPSLAAQLWCPVGLSLSGPPLLKWIRGPRLAPQAEVLPRGADDPLDEENQQ